jgi:hypothetical protein
MSGGVSIYTPDELDALEVSPKQGRRRPVVCEDLGFGTRSVSDMSRVLNAQPDNICQAIRLDGRCSKFKFRYAGKIAS